VKVFGCRPSQVEREAWGRRTETAQARTRGAQVRRYGDLKILVWPYGWRGDCDLRLAGGAWRNGRFTGMGLARWDGGGQADVAVISAIVEVAIDAGAW